MRRGLQVVVLELSHRIRATSEDDQIRINHAYTRRVSNQVRLEWRPEFFATRG